jgi:ribosomal protein S18 acetylase RimI-like enzyme
MINYTIQETTENAIHELLSLYKEVAEKSGGIIRRPEEITLKYVSDFIAHSLESGLTFTAVSNDTGLILGEIHAYSSGLQAFGHLLENLTIVVSPNAQSHGIGKALFIKFLEEVKENFRHILKVELFVREHNAKAVQFYQSLGFVIEGKLTHQILNVDGSLETPLMMSWFNPDCQLIGIKANF